ncbi:hypothetical protein HO173_008070 [Letharia columbiana]|uniref:Uncharacterized protein n=1 Tax=Letharia columbiana TaxID=112416 RepID=A0A8H6L362_9LECA|nr:uncharacterized protein HO173_008070 [Letharia columbiana]KAF6233858.1 hypothetical protein HO173_008070 [Letharia columbiana]
MDSSPSKRRRTSPSTSIAVTVENTDLGPLPRNGASPSRRRSSFMSPTKASLARFHPNILPRAKSVEPLRPVSKEIHDTFEQDPVVGGGTKQVVGHVAGTASKESQSGMKWHGEETWTSSDTGAKVTKSRRGQRFGKAGPVCSGPKPSGLTTRGSKSRRNGG